MQPFYSFSGPAIAHGCMRVVYSVFDRYCLALRVYQNTASILHLERYADIDDMDHNEDQNCNKAKGLSFVHVMLWDYF